MSEYVYDLAKKHHTVRQFQNVPLSEDVVEKLVEAAQSASTSSYLQTYSIIGIDDVEVKRALREVSGQSYVEHNGYLFVFVLDYYRHSIINASVEEDLEPSFESAEGLLVGTIDVALAAQNLAITAEDMGYGIVYLGSLRNDVRRVKDILGLPEYTFPLFGMAVGVPAEDEQGDAKPRLPLNHILHKNQYHTNVEEQREVLDTYDQVVKAYYEARTNGQRSETWSAQIAKFMSGKQRQDMLDALHESGLIKK